MNECMGLYTSQEDLTEELQALISSLISCLIFFPSLSFCTALVTEGFDRTNYFTRITWKDLGGTWSMEGFGRDTLVCTFAIPSGSKYSYQVCLIKQNVKVWKWLAYGYLTSWSNHREKSRRKSEEKKPFKGLLIINKK